MAYDHEPGMLTACHLSKTEYLVIFAREGGYDVFWIDLGSSAWQITAVDAIEGLKHVATPLRPGLMMEKLIGLFLAVAGEHDRDFTYLEPGQSIAGNLIATRIASDAGRLLSKPTGMVN
jgi:hypothetical protein